MKEEGNSFLKNASLVALGAAVAAAFTMPEEKVVTAPVTPVVTTPVDTFDPLALLQASGFRYQTSGTDPYTGTWLEVTDLEEFKALPTIEWYSVKPEFKEFIFVFGVFIAGGIAYVEALSDWSNGDVYDATNQVYRNQRFTGKSVFIGFMDAGNLRSIKIGS